MSTGSKVVLLLSFVFIGILVWYYGPSSESEHQIAQDPVLQQSTPAATVATRPEPTSPPTARTAPATRSSVLTTARPSTRLAGRTLEPMGPIQTTATTSTAPPSYLVMGQAELGPVFTPATTPSARPAPSAPVAPSSRAASVSTISATVETKPASPARTYVVTAGDTLSGISVMYYGTEVEWNRIAQANPDVDPDRLRIGTKLSIPAYTPRAARPARSAVATASTPRGPAGARTHRVEDGESLSSIADQYYGRETQWTRIFEANRDMLKGDPDRLRIGMVLAIPGK